MINRDKGDEGDKEQRNGVRGRRRSGHVLWSEFLSLDAFRPEHKSCHGSLSLGPLFLAVAGFTVPASGRGAFFDESSTPVAG